MYIYKYLLFVTSFSNCALLSERVKLHTRKIHNVNMPLRQRWGQCRSLQAPSSTRKHRVTSNLRCAIPQPMNYVMRLKAGGRVGCGMQRIASSKLQCKLIREYTWGSSLKVSGEGESKKNWNFAKLTCLILVKFNDTYDAWAVTFCIEISIFPWLRHVHLVVFSWNNLS